MADALIDQEGRQGHARAQDGREHMTAFDGQQDSLDEVEEVLRFLLSPSPA
jgi:hypothetical protein